MIKIRLQGTVFKGISLVDSRCECCGRDNLEADGLIEESEPCLVLDFHRTYELVRAKHMTPRTKIIIPEILRGSAKGIRPEDFREPVKAHKVCQSCYRKICLLFREEGIWIPDVLNKPEQIRVKDFFWDYTSKSTRAYTCDCCKVKDVIPKNSSYYRFCNDRCVCPGCYKALSPVLAIKSD